MESAAPGINLQQSGLYIYFTISIAIMTAHCNSFFRWVSILHGVTALHTLCGGRPEADVIEQLVEWYWLPTRTVGADSIRPWHKAPPKGRFVPGRLLVDPYSGRVPFNRVLLKIQSCGRILSAPTGRFLIRRAASLSGGTAVCCPLAFWEIDGYNEKKSPRRQHHEI